MIQNFTSAIKESRQYSDTIMTDIVSLLDKESISFTSNASTSEIVIKDKNKADISKLVRTLQVSNSVLYFMLEISQVKKNVYIRKKIK